MKIRTFLLAALLLLPASSPAGPVSSRLSLDRGLESLRVGDLAAARRHLLEALEVEALGPHPDERRGPLNAITFLLAVTEIRAGRWGVAETMLEKGIELLPDRDAENPLRVLRRELSTLREWAGRMQAGREAMAGGEDEIAERHYLAALRLGRELEPTNPDLTSLSALFLERALRDREPGEVEVRALLASR